MITRVISATLTGVSAELVQVEAEITPGISSFQIVGLPDARVQEARERIRSAIKQSGFQFPYNFRITINLAPAHVKKIGTAFDLPIALAILGKILNFPLPSDALFLGELGLDGSVRPVFGVLAAAQKALTNNIRVCFVPRENSNEAALLPNLTIFPLNTLTRVVDHLKNKRTIAAHIFTPTNEHPLPLIDFGTIAGNAITKRALEIAAVGQHHVLMSGPPGAGKTLMARALVGILPPLTPMETVEVVTIYSAAGINGATMGGCDTPALSTTNRPLRAPHHSSSAIALIGGGSPIRPGEITLAHNGVLFLDELPEFSRSVLEHLRQPIEDGVVAIARAEQSINFPARFQLIAARNPCPCGFATDQNHECVCSPRDLARYDKKISGPLLDRIDLFCEVARVPLTEIAVAHAQKNFCAEDSASIRARVNAARANPEPTFNLTPAIRAFSVRSAEQLKLSARGYARLMRVSRTIARLAASETIRAEHIAEALQFRHE